MEDDGPKEFKNKKWGAISSVVERAPDKGKVTSSSLV
jgi:hypothetical protein